MLVITECCNSVLYIFSYICTAFHANIITLLACVFLLCFYYLVYISVHYFFGNEMTSVKFIPLLLRWQIDHPSQVYDLRKTINFFPKKQKKYSDKESSDM